MHSSYLKPAVSGSEFHVRDKKIELIELNLITLKY